MANSFARQGLMQRQPIHASRFGMVDYFAILITHGVMAFALWRLLQRDDLDQEDSETKPRPFGKRKPRV
jgi:hypothetical protein